VADALRREAGVEVELTDGSRGEFTVLVDGQVVARKGLFLKPSVEKVVAAVRAVGQAPGAAKG
jgi:hypothetical protein